MILKRWIKNRQPIIRDFFSALGLFWMIKEIGAWLLTQLSIQIKTPDKLTIFFIMLFASILYGILKNRPKSSFEKKIRDKDIFIEIKIGDAFKNEGALVVPINNEFDLFLNGNESIQKKLTSDFYNSKEEHLKSDISSKIDLKKKPFKAGTVVEIEQKDKKFYLLVNSSKLENGRVFSDIDDFMLALNGIWDYLAKEKGDIVTIPLINSQHSKPSNLTRDIIVKRIIDTFIDASKHKILCDKLIISIHPRDLERGQLDFDSLGKYLEFQCNNYKEIKFNNKPEGLEIGPSTVKSIKA